MRNVKGVLAISLIESRTESGVSTYREDRHCRKLSE